VLYCHYVAGIPPEILPRHVSPTPSPRPVRQAHCVSVASRTCGRNVGMMNLDWSIQIGGK